MALVSTGTSHQWPASGAVVMRPLSFVNALLSALWPVKFPVHSSYKHCIMFLDVVSAVVSTHSRQGRGRTGGVIHPPSFDLIH